VTTGVRLAMWSGPRSISTALMRSWGNRLDCNVVDEPLYAYYLAQTGSDHPGRDEVIASGETSWRAVVSELTAPVDGIYYQKHMAQHLIPDLPRDWIGSLTNVLLVRDPFEVVASYMRSRSDVVDSDFGLVQQCELYEHFEALPVIDSSDFLRDPEGYLRWLCAHIGVDFVESMLGWPAGPRDSDGVWAPYWYETVLTSTSFEKFRPQNTDLDEAALGVVERAMPYYERLRSVRIVF